MNKTPKEIVKVIHYDERIGCVAVYRGKDRNCLSGIENSPDCLFYRDGVWCIRRYYCLMAKCMYWWNRLLERIKK